MAKQAVKQAVKKVSKAKSIMAVSPVTHIPGVPGLMDRHEMIASEAYLRAEQQGFHGDPVAHWLEAEADIDRAAAV